MKCIGWGLLICDNERNTSKGWASMYCESCEGKKLLHEQTLIEDGIEEGCFEDEDEIICPYCGYKDRNSWEAPEEDDEYECVSCEKVFQMCRNVTVTYSTYRIEQEDTENEAE